MRRPASPSTPAVRQLRTAGIPFTEHVYRYQEHGGTSVAARALNVDEHAVVKTIVLEDQDRNPLVVLMHGDREISTKLLARSIGCKTVTPCSPEAATRHTGYLVGGTSPFGLRKALPIYVERTILDLPALYLNGGSRGFLVELSPSDLVRVLNPVSVEVGITG